MQEEAKAKSEEFSLGKKDTQKIPTSTNDVYVVSAPMGSGKTAGVLESMTKDTNYLFCVPKIALADSICNRAKEHNDLDVEAIHSKAGYGGLVKDHIETALSEGRQGSLVIITQASLLEIDPYYLDGWTVIVDEIPNIDTCKSKAIGYTNFDDLFKAYVHVDKDLMCHYEPLELKEIQSRLTEAKRTNQEEIVLMYGGLLDATTEVQLEEHNGTWLIKHQGYLDYSNVIDGCDEFHIMGNGVEKTLFYLYLKAQGYRIKESPFTPAFNGYDMPPTLVPMVKGDRFSKQMMLTRDDGTESESFDKDCFGWKLLEEALEFHKNEHVLVQVFGWMKEAFPFKRYSNVEVTEFDVRGMNDHRDYHRTVNLIHSNPSPIQGRMQERMFEMMGVDAEEARQAVRHERAIEPMAQHILRTDMRNIGNQKMATVTVVPTMLMAKKIEEVLQIECNIDTSIMRDPPMSAAKVNRAELQRKAYELHLSGMSKVAIGRELDKDRKTIHKWIKEEEVKRAA